MLEIIFEKCLVNVSINGLERRLLLATSIGQHPSWLIPNMRAVPGLVFSIASQLQSQCEPEFIVCFAHWHALHKFAFKCVVENKFDMFLLKLLQQRDCGSSDIPQSSGVSPGN